MNWREKLEQYLTELEVEKDYTWSQTETIGEAVKKIIRGESIEPWKYGLLCKEIRGLLFSYELHLIGLLRACRENKLIRGRDYFISKLRHIVKERRKIEGFLRELKREKERGQHERRSRGK